MKTGSWLTLIGGLVLAVAVSALPWQRFELAGIAASALELGAFGAVMLGLALALSATAVFGVVSGRRRLALRVTLGLCGALAVGLLGVRVDATMGLTLMPHEVITASGGWSLALVGVGLALAGGIMTRATLSAWDESSPLLRMSVLRDGHSVERIVYEPGTVAFAALDGSARGAVTVTSEGDTSIAFDGDARIVSGGRVRHAHGSARLEVGDRVTIVGAGYELTCAFVAPSGLVGGRIAARTLHRSEVWAFGAAVATAFVAGIVAPVLAWTEEANIAPLCEANMCAGVVAETKVAVTPEDVVVPTPSEPLEERSSKAAGGPEGRLGDPTIVAPRETKAARIDAPLVTPRDPKRLGLNQLLSEQLATRSTVAEVLRGDVAATTDRIARAMEGDGSELVLGPGRGLAFQGDGEGGPGDDAGRMLAMGEIDEGGPGIHPSTGPKPKRRVGVLDNAPTTTHGYCSQANIRSVVMRRAAAIRSCYEQRLQQKGSLAGKLTVRWTIGLDGAVESASALSDGLGDAQTTRCVVDWVRRMHFEKPDGGLCVVQWPFVFSSGG